MKKIFVQTVVGLAAAGVWLTPTAARAQDPYGPAPQAAPAPSATVAAAPAAPAPAPAAPVPAKERDEGDTDHDRFIGHLGVTYFDITALPISNALPDPGNGMPAQPGPGGITAGTVNAPVIGVRYWFQRMIGIDVGLGLGIAGGTTEAIANNVDTTVDKISSTGFALHGGVPIAFAEGRHYTFLAIPEVNLGFTSATFKPTQVPNGPGLPEQDLSGFLFDIGARVGAEIHFGFMGVPQLALQATVGLSYRRSVYKWSSVNNSASDGTNTFGTNVNADPWAIFKDAISATYYF